MADIRIKIDSRQLPSAARAMMDEVRKGTVDVMRRAARFGHTITVTAANRHKPKPRATGTYINAWVVKHTPRGAIIGNSAKHAYFVEVGRDPGPVPLAPILEWAKLKRLPAGLGKIKGRGAKAKKAEIQRQFAEAVAWKIRHHGILGKHILKKQMPRISKRVDRELRKEIPAALRRARVPKARITRKAPPKPKKP